LRAAFEDHLGQTRQHAQRLETIFEQMGEKTSGKKCKGMEGLVKEGSETIREDMEDSVKDAAIIAAAQRVEHYEIAGYGCVHAFATRLGEDDAASLLAETLEEEKKADQLLNGIAEQLNMDIPAESEQSQKRPSKTTGHRKTAA
jgi:ferritin-like metal-binding protein YciE